MVKISDVAKLAGVSSGTVSRVMNGASNVLPETRLKVQAAIAELSYQPNLQARSLRSRRTDTIALAIPELTNYFWTTVVRGVQDAAQTSGYYVLICNTLTKSRQNLRYLTSIINRVDGMILSRRSEWEALVGAEANGISPVGKPIVMVGQSHAARWNVSNVYSDSVSGAFRLTEHLIDLGHRQIAVVTGRQSSASASDRVAGYGLALYKAQLPLNNNLIRWGEYDRHTAERLTHELLEAEPDTSAIVAANNEIAIGVAQALEKRHKHIPQDMALVCFDDFYPDSRFASFMTVASQSPYDIGINAADLLLKRLHSDDYIPTQSVVLPTRLIVRQSCGGTPTPIIDLDTAYEGVQGELILPLTPETLREAVPSLSLYVPNVADIQDDLLTTDKVNVALLKKVLLGQSEGHHRLPHFEYELANPQLYRTLLEREPRYQKLGHSQVISAEDQIEYAVRCGFDAAPCRLPYQIDREQLLSVDVQDWPLVLPRFTDLLDWFDSYTRAARRAQFGIVADFHCLVADILSFWDTLKSSSPKPEVSLRQLADSLFDHYRKTVQLLCDRFSHDFACVILSDRWADERGMHIPMDSFEEIFYPHLQSIVRSIQSYGLPVVLHTSGKVDGLIGQLRQLGFDGLYIAQPEINDLAAIRRDAGRDFSLLGGVSAALLNHQSEALIEAEVQRVAATLGGGQRYVLGLGGGNHWEIDRQSLFAYLRVTTRLKGNE
jgi:LacI family transcriptional regulator